jgi:hypothetical protein
MARPLSPMYVADAAAYDSIERIANGPAGVVCDGPLLLENPSVRFLSSILLIGLAMTAMAQDKTSPPSTVAVKMRESAERLLAALPERQRRTAMRPFDDRDRVDWHYTPHSRNGISLKELDPGNRDAVHALLKTALSAVGYRKVVNIIELELVLREMETFGLMRDPERYHLTFYGTPSRTDRWGWRFEGHHLSLNFTLAGERLVVDTPSFFGANPATVPSGPKKGLRTLGEEHDAGWAVLDSLSDAQRRDAVISTRTYGDIVTSNKEKVEPLDASGILGSKLDERQRALLWKIVELYASSFEPGLANARLDRARHGGIENLRFGWAGSTTRGAPHYYRVQGTLFLIEYDASQDGGNHIHTVWRDFAGDFGRNLSSTSAFGRDLLRDHYASAQDTSHRH